MPAFTVAYDTRPIEPSRSWQRALLQLAKEQGIFEKTIFLFGGPRVDHKTALELGFDAGFGPALLERGHLRAYLAPDPPPQRTVVEEGDVRDADHVAQGVDA